MHNHISNSDGSSGPIDIVIVETPVPSQVTSYVSGMVSSAFAISTYTSFTTDSNDSSCPIDIVIVETLGTPTSSLGSYHKNIPTVSTTLSLPNLKESESLNKNILSTRSIEPSNSNN